MSEATAQPGVCTPQMLRPYLAEIDRFVSTCLNERVLPANLREAVMYAVEGGKYLRPLLCVLCCRAAGSDWRRSLPAGAALEFIHAFSLVHDDLPAMDDDRLRRGAPTLWVKFGEAMAILAGDALHTLAFELLCDERYTAAQRAALIRELSHATIGMIAGQVYDTLGGMGEGIPPREQLETIHNNKTAALIRGACRMGGIVADADAGATGPLTRYGEAIGLMFQIVDDLIDVEQLPEHTGKATGKDAVAGKLTFPGLLGVEASRNEVERLRKQASDAAACFGERGRELVELADFMAVRTR